jgi:inner membrane transporter RhtA
MWPVSSPAPDSAPGSRVGRIPPVWLILGSIVSVQLGAAIAKGLFGAVTPTVMVWLRLACASIVMLVIARPRLRGHTRRDWLVALGFGVCLMVTNWSFYQSFARIPLGIAVTIEFLGPLSIAVIGSKRPRDLLWVLLAGAGVALLGFSPHGINLPGVLFGLLAALGWATYILLSAQTGRRWPGLTGLAVAGVVGAVVLAPAALIGTGTALFRPHILLLGLAIGLLSSVVPYSLELVALRRLPKRVFGILMSLEPAAAAFAAMLVLGEFLRPVQWAAVACVVAASLGATRSARPASAAT